MFGAVVGLGARSPPPVQAISISSESEMQHLLNKLQILTIVPPLCHGTWSNDRYDFLHWISLLCPCMQSAISTDYATWRLRKAANNIVQTASINWLISAVRIISYLVPHAGIWCSCNIKCSEAPSANTAAWMAPCSFPSITFCNIHNQPKSDFKDFRKYSIDKRAI